jgi:hypothetical protein
MRQLQQVDILSNHSQSPIHLWLMVIYTRLNRTYYDWHTPVILLGKFSIPDQINNYLTYEQT